MSETETQTSTTKRTATAKKKQKSYFFLKKINRYYLDEESFIEHKPLDEGLFQAYQDLTSQIILDSKGDTQVDMKLGAQREFLQHHLVKGWNLVDDEGDPVEYHISKLRELPPEIINGLMDDITKKNKILGGDDDEAKKE